MNAGTTVLAAFSLQVQARAARAEVESALDATGWPWFRRLSLWLDILACLEEAPR